MLIRLIPSAFALGLLVGACATTVAVAKDTPPLESELRNWAVNARENAAMSGMFGLPLPYAAADSLALNQVDETFNAMGKEIGA